MGTWFNNDGLYLKYGTQKTTATTAGDYKSFGDTRILELTIDLTLLTASPVIQNDVTFFGPNMLIEEITTDVDVAGVGGTSFSVGLIGLDRTTVDSNTKFLSAAPIADHNALGAKKSYVAGVTGVGSGIGTTVTNPGYITALAAGTYSAGKLKVRIRYRGFGTITQ